MTDRIDEIVHEVNIDGCVLELTKSEMMAWTDMFSHKGYAVFEKFLQARQVDINRVCVATDAEETTRHQYIGAYWNNLSLLEDVQESLAEQLERAKKGAGPEEEVQTS